MQKFVKGPGTYEISQLFKYLWFLNISDNWFQNIIESFMEHPELGNLQTG